MTEQKLNPVQLYICTRTEQGRKSINGTTYHLIASDGTVYNTYGSSSPMFAFYDLIGDYPTLRKHLDLTYGKRNWKVRYLWEESGITFNDLNKLVKAKYKKGINSIYAITEYKRAKDNINTTLNFVPSFNETKPKKKVKKQDMSWWNGNCTF